MFKESLLHAYSVLPDTPLQLSEENEWLKLLESDYDVRSVEVDFHERDLNTIGDLIHLTRLFNLPSYLLVCSASGTFQIQKIKKNHWVLT